MALFGPQILVWSVAVAACGLILHNTGYRPLKSPQAIEAQLGLYDLAAETPDTFVVYAGKMHVWSDAAACTSRAPFTALMVVAAKGDLPAEAFVVHAGRLLLFVSTLAWAVVIGQSLVSAARRYRRTPAGKQQLP